MSSYTMWDRDGLYVWASRSESGGVTINGQDLRSGPGGSGEYEYAVSIPVEDVPIVVKALGGSEGDDVLELLRTNGEMIVRRGERTWAKEIGVSAKLWNHGDAWTSWPKWLEDEPPAD